MTILSITLTDCLLLGILVFSNLILFTLWKIEDAIREKNKPSDNDKKSYL